MASVPLLSTHLNDMGMVPVMWLLSTWKRRTPLLMVPKASGMVPMRLLCSNLASAVVGRKQQQQQQQQR
jgi:hypothetical protein